MANWEDMVVVGRIARPHGLRGHVIVNPETDFVDERFRPGAEVWIRSAGGARRLTIVAARVQGGRPVVAFDGLARLEDVEEMSGLELRIPEDALQPLEPGRYYEHQLVGCTVETIDGAAVGPVVRVEGGAGSSRLVVEGRSGEVLIPLAVDICVEIDIAARRIRIQPPEGLLELNEAGPKGPALRTRRPGPLGPGET
jgi:16S rRNA processing protein RimM